MNYKITQRQITFTFPVPEKFEAKGWGGSQKYNTLEISVGYAQGGMSYFTGESSPRGFYLYFNPVNLSMERGFETREFIMGTGAKQLLKTAERYSAKTLQELAGKLEPVAKELSGYYIANEREEVLRILKTLIQEPVTA